MCVRGRRGCGVCSVFVALEGAREIECCMLLTLNAEIGGAEEKQRRVDASRAPCIIKLDRPWTGKTTHDVIIK